MLSRTNGSEPPSSSTTFLRLRAGDLGDRCARALRAGHRHALHARVGDDVCDLLVRRVDVDVRVRGEAGVVVDRLDRGGRLRALRRVLEQDRVADDEVRAGEARDLVVGEVPRHDPEEHADGAAADERGAVAVGERRSARRPAGWSRCRRSSRRCRRRSRSHRGPARRLAHLAGDDLRERVATLRVELADAPDEGGALLDRRRARPLAVRPIGGRDRVHELRVADRRVGLAALAGCRVDHRVVAHLVLLLGRRIAESFSRPETRSAPRLACQYPGHHFGSVALAREHRPRDTLVKWDGGSSNRGVDLHGEV